MLDDPAKDPSVSANDGGSSNVVFAIDKDVLEAALSRPPAVASLLASLREGRLIWVGSLVLGIVLSIFLATWLPETYQATTTLYPASEDSEVPNPLRSALGFLKPTSSTTEEALATLNSTSFLIEFIEKENLMDVFFPSQEMTAVGKTSLELSVFFRRFRAWLRNDSFDEDMFRKRKVEKTVLDGVVALRGDLTINTTPQSPIVTLHFTNGDRELSARILNELVVNLNAKLRSIAIEESERLIEQFLKQAAETTVVEVRHHLFVLATEETKQLVTARETEEFAFRIVDPAFAPEQPSSPRRAIIVILGTLLGLTLGIFLALLRHFFKDEQENAAAAVGDVC